MKFSGTCIVCNEKIEANEIGLWAKGIGIKHERCAESKELKCVLCGNPAGCPQCEFRDDCDLDNVSELCLCKKCSSQPNAFLSYQKHVSQNYMQNLSNNTKLQ